MKHHSVISQYEEWGVLEKERKTPAHETRNFSADSGTYTSGNGDTVTQIGVANLLLQNYCNVFCYSLKFSKNYNELVGIIE